MRVTHFVHNVRLCSDKIGDHRRACRALMQRLISSTMPIKSSSIRSEISSWRDWTSQRRPSHEVHVIELRGEWHSGKYCPGAGRALATRGRTPEIGNFFFAPASALARRFVSQLKDLQNIISANNIPRPYRGIQFLEPLYCLRSICFGCLSVPSGLMNGSPDVGYIRCPALCLDYDPPARGVLVPRSPVADLLAGGLFQPSAPYCLVDACSPL